MDIVYFQIFTSFQTETFEIKKEKKYRICFLDITGHKPVVYTLITQGFIAVIRLYSKPTPISLVVELEDYYIIIVYTI